MATLDQTDVKDGVDQDTVDAVAALSGAYKYGWETEIEMDYAPKGVNTDIVKLISSKNEEPLWMTDWRLDAFARWEKLDEPTWAMVNYPDIDFQDIYYYARPKSMAVKPKSLDDVDPKLLATYAKLGIPLKEQAILAGVEGADMPPAEGRKVAVDAVFDSVSVGTTFQAELKKAGVIFCSISEAIREAYRRGAVISGSSAGAAMMSRIMITGDQKMEPDYERTYARLYADNGVYQTGLGLIENAVIDQHFVERSRYNRALSALHDHPGLPVFGIGESTALVVAPDGISVEGEGHVVVFHPHSGAADSSGQLSFRDLRLDILTAGDRLAP